MRECLYVETPVCRQAGLLPLAGTKACRHGSPAEGDSRVAEVARCITGTGLPWLTQSEAIRFFCLKKEEGDEIVDQNGTTLIELIIVLVVIMVVGVALVLPNVSTWYPMVY